MFADLKAFEEAFVKDLKVWFLDQRQSNAEPAGFSETCPRLRSIVSLLNILISFLFFGDSLTTCK